MKEEHKYEFVGSIDSIHNYLRGIDLEDYSICMVCIESIGESKFGLRILDSESEMEGHEKMQLSEDLDS